VSRLVIQPAANSVMSHSERSEESLLNWKQKKEGYLSSLGMTGLGLLPQTVQGASIPNKAYCPSREAQNKTAVPTMMRYTANGANPRRRT
jgi:hypothetical protein